MENVSFSVIIPVYNLEKMLPESLESCMLQDYPEAEFICVNDGSTDGSLEVLKRYAAMDPRIKVIDNPKGNVCTARNAGLDAARGDWIVFLDGDDRLMEGALKTLNERIGQKPGARIIIYNSTLLGRDSEEEKWYAKTLRFPEASYGAFTPKVLFEEPGSLPFIWRQAYSAKLLKGAPGKPSRFDPELPFGEDVLFIMSVFPGASGFEFITDCLYAYRLNREGGWMDSVQSDAEEVVRRHFIILEKVCRLWQEKGWIELYGAALLKWCMKFVALKIKALPGKKRKAWAQRFFEDIAAGFGLDKYRKSLDAAGAAMWSLLKAFRML